MITAAVELTPCNELLPSPLSVSEKGELCRVLRQVSVNNFELFFQRFCYKFVWMGWFDPNNVGFSFKKRKLPINHP